MPETHISKRFFPTSEYRELLYAVGNGEEKKIHTRMA